MWVFVCPGEEREGNACGCLSVLERSARVMHVGVCLSRRGVRGYCMWVSVCRGEECEGNACGCLSVAERSARVMHVGVCLSRRGVRG